MKSYRFTSFDERFWKLEEVELANWNDEYSLVQQLWWNIVVQGKDDPIILWEWKNWKVSKKNVITEIKLPENVKKVVLSGETAGIKTINMQAVKNKSGLVIEGTGAAERLFRRMVAQEAKSREM